MKEYVRGEVHTHGIENFWCLLKRGLSGTYVSVEPFHLDRYVDEQAFRFNNRATKDNPLNDADRFALAVSQIAGKRLTYAELTGKVGETERLGCAWLGTAETREAGFRRSLRFFLCIQFGFDFRVRHRDKSPHETYEMNWPSSPSHSSRIESERFATCDSEKRGYTCGVPRSDLLRPLTTNRDSEESRSIPEMIES